MWHIQTVNKCCYCYLWMFLRGRLYCSHFILYPLVNWHTGGLSHRLGKWWVKKYMLLPLVPLGSIGYLCLASIANMCWMLKLSINSQLAGREVCLHIAGFTVVVTCEVIMLCLEILNDFWIRGLIFLFCTGYQNYAVSPVYIYTCIITFTDTKDVWHILTHNKLHNIFYCKLPIANWF